LVVMTGGQAVVEVLRAEGLKYVFGIPGTTTVPIVDALAKYPDMTYILGLNESVVVGMAHGYAQATGRPSFVNIHAMIGTAHSLGNLINAYKDGSPVVLNPCVPDNRFLGDDCFLDARDAVETVQQFTKWSWLAQGTDTLPQVFRRAFKVAAAPPTGPTFVATPTNILADKADVTLYQAERYHVTAGPRGDPDKIRAAAEVLAKSKSPIIVAGRGVAKSGAVPELVKLAELLGAAVFAEPHNILLNFPTDHPQYLGGLERSSPLVSVADVVLGVGCKMFTEFIYIPAPVVPETAKIIHVNVDPWEIGKAYPADIGIIADAKLAARDLHEALASSMTREQLSGCKERAKAVKKINDQMQAEAEEFAKKDFDAKPIKGWRLVKDMKAVASDAIIVSEGMSSAGYLAALYDFHKPGSYYATSGSCMGWASSAALGVKLANPDRPVIAFVGDGCFSMSFQSLWTAARYNIPAVIMVLDNYEYMAIKAALFAYKGYAAEKKLPIGVDLGNPNVDYAKLSESLGVHGVKVESPEEIKPALKEALSSGRPELLDVILDPRETGYRRPRLQ